MPQSVYPVPFNEDIAIADTTAQVSREELVEASERIAKQLAIITGLDAEKGEL